MQPLSGITILEAGAYITVPYAAMMLADLGANVIKIERPGGGDPFRRFNGGTYRAHFRSANRTKRSVVVDLKKPEGREIFKRMALKADMVIENNRPGVMDELGLGYDALSPLNPRLIYCSVTGFGPDGPYRDRPAFDTVGQAMSGLLSLMVDPENPRLTGTTAGDCVTGMYACQAALAGVLQRYQTGKGCRVETNMLAASMAFLEFWFVEYYDTKILPDMYRKSAVNTSFAMRGSDGKMFAIHLSSLPKFWEGLLKTVNMPELGTDPRFARRSERTEHYEELRQILVKAFAVQPRAHWLAELEKNDVPFAPIYTFDEHEHDPQVQHLGLMYDMVHPTLTDPRDKITKMLKRPIWIDGQTDTEHAVPPPLLGEHTHAVLSEFGYSEAELAGLEKAGIIENYQP